MHVEEANHDARRDCFDVARSDRLRDLAAALAAASACALARTSRWGAVRWCVRRPWIDRDRGDFAWIRSRATGFVWDGTLNVSRSWRGWETRRWCRRAWWWSIAGRMSSQAARWRR